MHSIRPKLRGKRQTIISERLFENLSDLASLKNNFAEQLTDDEDGDSAPFSRESEDDANKQPLTPPIYHSPSPQEVFAPFPQRTKSKPKRERGESIFC
ncbi:hypothetical protein TNCV_591121 [Trichonephila clavipes]|nr:hypothetical protein TNCV_591121 [Trichonephila clavipes]